MKYEINKILYQNKTIRQIEYQNAKWFCIEDIVGILTDSPSPFGYWRMIKAHIKLRKWNNEPLIEWEQLELISIPNINRSFDYTNHKGVLIILKNIPADCSHLLKKWLLENS